MVKVDANYGHGKILPRISQALALLRAQKNFCFAGAKK